MMSQGLKIKGGTSDKASSGAVLSVGVRSFCWCRLLLYYWQNNSHVEYDSVGHLSNPNKISKQKNSVKII